jgi:hypothetical protein
VTRIAQTAIFVERRRELLSCQSHRHGSAFGGRVDQPASDQPQKRIQESSAIQSMSGLIQYLIEIDRLKPVQRGSATDRCLKQPVFTAGDTGFEGCEITRHMFFLPCNGALITVRTQWAARSFAS